MADSPSSPDALARHVHGALARARLEAILLAMSFADAVQGTAETFGGRHRLWGGVSTIVFVFGGGRSGRPVNAIDKVGH